MLTLRLVEEVPDQSKRKESEPQRAQATGKNGATGRALPQRAGRVLTLARRRRKAKGKGTKGRCASGPKLTVATESVHSRTDKG